MGEVGRFSPSPSREWSTRSQNNCTDDLDATEGGLPARVRIPKPSKASAQTMGMLTEVVGRLEGVGCVLQLAAPAPGLIAWRTRPSQQTNRARAREVAPKDHPRQSWKLHRRSPRVIPHGGVERESCSCRPAPSRARARARARFFSESGRRTLTGILRKRQNPPHQKT